MPAPFHTYLLSIYLWRDPNKDLQRTPAPSPPYPLYRVPGGLSEMVQIKYLVPPELHLSSHKLAAQKEQEKAENDRLWSIQ